MTQRKAKLFQICVAQFRMTQTYRSQPPLQFVHGSLLRLETVHDLARANFIRSPALAVNYSQSLSLGMFRTWPHALQ
jgi:hypothetical protein